MNYEQWGAGAFGSDGYNEGFGDQGFAPPPGGFQPSNQPNEDFSQGSPEIRIPAPKPAIDNTVLNQTRALLGLGAVPAPVSARPKAAPRPPVSKSTYLVPLVIAGAIGAAYWYWWRK